MADAAGMTVHQYVMTRVTAMGDYDAKTKKFVSDNPEDLYNLTDDEKTYMFIKPMASKNILLWSGKEGGLNGPEAKKALLTLRQKDRNVDSYDGRDVGGKILAFFTPGDQTITVQQAYDFAKSGKGTNFGLYGISAEDMIRLVDAGILNPDADFDENTQDFAAFGLMYLQANSGNSIMGAQTEALDWRYLVGLDQQAQATVLQFFPNLRDVPMLQFQNVQKDVGDAILTDVESYQFSTEEFIKKNPEMADLFTDYGTTFDFINKASTLPGIYDKEAANDPRREKLYKYFQGLVNEGKYVPFQIKRALTMVTPKSEFNYFRKQQDE